MKVRAINKHTGKSATKYSDKGLYTVDLYCEDCVICKEKTDADLPIQLLKSVFEIIEVTK